MNITAFKLDEMKTTELRKLASELGIKGMSSAKGADLRAAIAPIQAEQIRAAEEVAEAKLAKRGVCTDCGRKEGFRGSELCDECREYAEWENTHSDENHEDDTVLADGCQVCHPELDGRTPKRAGRSRLGMVIVAKGTEIHKSETFRVAAEAAGWTVTVTGEHYDEQDDATRYYADAYKGENAIQLAWDGRAYDYPASSALINGKSRKVRNLKEALRLLAV